MRRDNDRRVDRLGSYLKEEGILSLMQAQLSGTAFLIPSCNRFTSATVELCSASETDRIDRGGHHVRNIITHTARTACRHGCRRSDQHASGDAARGVRRRSNPPFHLQLPAGGDRRAAPAHRCHALAGARARVRRGFPADLVDPGRGRPNARRAARHDAEAHAVLGNGIRLEQMRGAVEGAAALRHQDRRPRHPLHPCEIQASGRPARHHHARLARFGH